MKTTFAKLTLATLLIGTAACASAPRTSAPTIIASSSAIDVAPDEEAGEEWTSDCRQELGQDSGDAARAHLIEGGDWISGCFVNGDDVDGFVIDVPAGVNTPYQIELVHRGGAAISTALVSPSGAWLASDALSEGAHINRSLILESGGRYVLRVAKAPGTQKAWYRLKASPQTQVAAK